MTRSVLLITGTSSGIGAATAVAAARAGHSVIATMRDLAKRASLENAAREAGVEFDLQQLDVTDPASIEDCFSRIGSEYGRLDAVVNNAGAGHVGTIEEEGLEDVRDVMEVNFYGVVAVSRAALPLLRASGGRLVTLSSVGGVVGQPFNEAYCASKFAVEGFMESLTPVAATVGVRVSVVEPGAVTTEFVANVDLERSAPAAGSPYRPAFDAYIARTTAAFSPENAQTAQSVAEVVVRLLSEENPPARVQTSDSARGFAGVKLADLDGSAVQSITTRWVARS